MISLHIGISVNHRFNTNYSQAGSPLSYIQRTFNLFGYLRSTHRVLHYHRCLISNIKIRAGDQHGTILQTPQIILTLWLCKGSNTRALQAGTSIRAHFRKCSASVSLLFQQTYKLHQIRSKCKVTIVSSRHRKKHMYMVK